MKHREASIARIAGTLGQARHPGRLPLGNRRDPLDELIYIILTTMTQFGAPEAFKDLKAMFRTWEDVLLPGGPRRLRGRVEVLGLANQKAPQIVTILRRLRRDFGAVSLKPLRAMSDDRAENYLLSLPRVGKKIARCVLMYSLDREVLPVDAHVLRVAKRVGLVDGATSWSNAHDKIQESVPPRFRYGIHVSFVIHGRSICTSKRPRCGECVLARMGLCNWWLDTR